MVGRHGKYLFKRANSANWHLRLVYPPEMVRTYKVKRTELSLGTSDRDEAMILALPRILQHKKELLVVRSMMRNQTMAMRFVHEPGREYLKPDGSKIVATSAQLIHIAADGVVSKIEPNLPREKTIWQVTPAEARALGITEQQIAGMVFARQAASKPAPTPVDNDFKLLDAFLALKPRNKHYNCEARATWEEFKRFVGQRPLKECTRKDGVAFVQHLRETRKVKTATIVKLMNYLAAPINHASETGDVRSNPFYKVVDQKKDALRRLPLTEADMNLCRRLMLPKLGNDELLLWMMCATTGMRHSEAYQATEEFKEGGVRYILIGKKTDTSHRRVPIPDALAPYLPKEIVGPLFQSNLKNVSKNLLRALRRVGITDERKVVYSLRHRAHDRLRAAGCPLDIQQEIVGHDNLTAHAGYGHGYPVKMLKEWVEKIGCGEASGR